MQLTQELLEAPDRRALRAILRGSSPEGLRDAVEPLAAEVLRLLRSEPRRAFEVAERAELVAGAAGDPEAKARARWIKGHVLSGVTRLREAVECYREAARAYRALGKHDQVARIAIGHVNALTFLGRYHEALDIGEKARKALVRSGQRGAAARMDFNLGNIHQRIERPGRALAHYDRALRVARREKDPGMIRMIQLNRGTVLSALGNLDRAESLFLAVRGETREAGETRIGAIVDFNLGYILFQRGEYGRAYDTLDAARRVFEDLGDEHYLTGTLIDLTELLIEVNSFARASGLAAEARACAEKIGFRFEVGRSTLFQAVSALGQGSVGEAESFLEDARETFREEGNTSSEAVCEVYLAEVAARREDAESAVRLLRRAVGTFRKERMRLHEGAARLGKAAVDLSRNRLQAARRELDEAGKALRGVPSPWLRARLSHLRGRLAERKGSIGWAVRHYRRAVDSIESIRGRIGIDEFRVSFAEDKAPVYADLVDALLRQDRPDAVSTAFAYVERARSRALVDLLAGRLGVAAGGDEASARLLQRMESLRAEINRLSGLGRASHGERRSFRRNPVDISLLRKREAEMAETVRRLERRNARLGALAVGETISLEEAQRDLPPGTTIVEYFLGPRRSWAFLITADSARAVPLSITPREATRWLAQLRFQIEKNGYGEEYTRSRRELLRKGVERHLRRLAEQLWDPLEVPEGRVVIIPHGPLHSLPFSALPLRDGGHVLDRHLVTYLPSVSCRRYFSDADAGEKCRRRGRETPGGAGSMSVLTVEVGDERIPDVQREVKHVRAVFREGKTLDRRRATRAGFREAARNADVIHIATHGIFRGDDPGFSALRMADGWMSLYDVYGLDLNASLVCLSACQSGRNWVGPGDELVGLSRGFLYAGASTLLVSLWPVNDRSTAELMIRFYRNLREGGEVDESLRNAMLSLRDEFEHPYHWAPFVLVGGSPPGRAEAA